MWKQRDPLVHCLWQKHWKAQKLVPWAWSLCAPPAWLANLPALGYGWAQTRTCPCGTRFYQIMQHVTSKLNSSEFCVTVSGFQENGLLWRKYHRTISVSSRGLSFLTHVGRPSWMRGFWLGNSPPGNISSLLYWVTQRLCFKNPALLRNFASGRARGRQFEPGTSL